MINASISTITVEDLKDKKSVNIRGFLYSTEEGEWILASQPNLKSCCVRQDIHHIVVEGDFSGTSSHYVVELTGNLVSFKEGYILSEASFTTSHQNQPTKTFLFLGLFIVCCLIFLRFKPKRM